ncbi:NO-inducible flavohemoprotein [Paracoccus aerodenitrificans]|uniref:NO-inducible flavohemoprotein n=1 Tax=Paracoccus aerodenitrificans TaxID=3017781 RepID=UPI0022EFE288|nr:NO-inducible flavohemoprotein [Paracoccus aerodenitrificans]WBU63354.1 NO-inducible flavohemoprotein [Paracoccus aerodenitrificans]
MSQPLSEKTISIIEATAPAVAGHIDEIVPCMYQRLLTDPEIRALFNMSHQHGNSPQHKALASALVAYATHIRNPEVLGTAIERIAQKHAGLQILPEHYPHVGDALLGAVAEVLGDAITPEILAAWGEAYWFLADILIGREEQIYTSSEHAAGGWRGWRRFRVAAKTPETDEIISFLLEPVDGAAVQAHRPGQYLSFRFQPAEGEEYRRNYSISSAPNGQNYRITIKREPEGKISNWLHDSVEPGAEFDVAPPAGEFFLDPQGKSEIVLLSGGVGLTPMVSMLESFGGKELPMLYVHATRDPRHHAMRERPLELASESHVFYETADESDLSAPNTHAGRVNPEWLVQISDPKIADYFICGPTGFMDAMITGLKAANVPDNRIHYEFFGPAAAELG